MKKEQRRFTAKQQATLTMCLLVAFTIASIALTVGFLLEGANHTPHQQEEKLNEDAEDTPINLESLSSGDSDLVPVTANAGDPGGDRYSSEAIPRYCYLTVAFDDEIPAITRANSLRMTMDVCLPVAEYLLDGAL